MADAIRCAHCGETFDPAHLDAVVYHENVPHRPVAATGIVGSPATPEGAGEVSPGLLPDDDLALLRQNARDGWGIPAHIGLTGVVAHIDALTAERDDAATGRAQVEAWLSHQVAEVERLQEALREVEHVAQEQVMRGRPVEYRTASEPIGVRGGVVTTREGDLCDMRDAIERVTRRALASLRDAAALSAPRAPEAEETQRDKDINTVASFITGWWPGLEDGISDWSIPGTDNHPVYLAAKRLLEEE